MNSISLAIACLILIEIEYRNCCLMPDSEEIKLNDRSLLMENAKGFFKHNFVEGLPF
jgi:hypothetical protein